MKIALAGVKFETCSTDKNKRKIISVMEKLSKKADLVLFGEAFLQGFEALSWAYSKDEKTALSLESEAVIEIKKAAKSLDCAVSFGFYEKYGDKIYSSQLSLSKKGETMDLFRRVSRGWKESIADLHYVEGDSFHVFSFMGKSLAVGLCGDLWYEENIEKMKRLAPSAVLWPVYTDYNAEEWNKAIKHEYAKQAGKILSPVLYVNSYCEDGKNENTAKGGAALFEHGKICKEIPSGYEDILIVDV